MSPQQPPVQAAHRAVPVLWTGPHGSHGSHHLAGGDRRALGQRGQHRLVGGAQRRLPGPRMTDGEHADPGDHSDEGDRPAPRRSDRCADRRGQIHPAMSGRPGLRRRIEPPQHVGQSVADRQRGRHRNRRRYRDRHGHGRWHGVHRHGIGHSHSHHSHRHGHRHRPAPRACRAGPLPRWSEDGHRRGQDQPQDQQQHPPAVVQRRSGREVHGVQCVHGGDSARPARPTGPVPSGLWTTRGLCTTRSPGRVSPGGLGRRSPGVRRFPYTSLAARRAGSTSHALPPVFRLVSAR